MKNLSLILSAALALCAAGCSSEPAATEPEATTGAEAAPAPAPAAEPAPVAEAAPAPAAEPPPPPPPPPPAMPSSSVLVVHKVKDYEAWKPGFDAHETARRDQMGAKAHAVTRDVKDAKKIGVWIAMDDLTKFDAAFASEDMKKVMKDAGVVGKPTVYKFKHVDMSPPTDKHPKFGALVDHKVKDFASFKTAFESGAQLRADAGIVGHAVMTDPEDPNHVYVWVDAEDQAKLEAFFASKELKAKMKEAGVKGAPKITVVESLEFKMYQ